jgi:Rrf2 family transcriptional regulator, iron-sulfur cluster assembly transcription factor
VRLELTRRGDYAVRAMLSIAANDGQPPISVRRIAEAMSIPPPILPQVMRDLVRAGLVVAQTGRTGGYRLGRPAGEISLLAVIEALEGDTRRQTCVLRGGPCARDGRCAVHEVFFRAQEALRDELGRATLQNVVAAADGVALRSA